MHRFFVPPDTLQAAPLIQLSGPLAHQIGRVLHLQPGEQIVLLDNSGDETVVELTGVSGQRVTAQLTERRRGQGEPDHTLTLYQALLKKGEQMDYILQKGTEIGLSHFVPVVTERTISRTVSPAKLERWRRIIQEAAEQTGRARLPSLAPVQPLADVPASGLLVCWEEERVVGLSTALTGADQSPTALLIGPEGGLTAAEVAHLTAAGARTVTLGRRILRADTAGLVAASLLLAASGDLGRPRPQ